MNTVVGGDFNSGFFSGMLSSIFKAVQIASGGLSGGFSSMIVGGNFWRGVRQGLITSGLNLAAHAFVK